MKWDVQSWWSEREFEHVQHIYCSLEEDSGERLSCNEKKKYRIKTNGDDRQLYLTVCCASFQWDAMFLTTKTRACWCGGSMIDLQ